MWNIFCLAICRVLVLILYKEPSVSLCILYLCVDVSCLTALKLKTPAFVSVVVYLRCVSSFINICNFLTFQTRLASLSLYVIFMDGWISVSAIQICQDFYSVEKCGLCLTFYTGSDIVYFSDCCVNISWQILQHCQQCWCLLTMNHWLLFWHVAESTNRRPYRALAFLSKKARRHLFTSKLRPHKVHSCGG